MVRLSIVLIITLAVTKPALAEPFDLSCVGKVTSSDVGSGYPDVGTEVRQTAHVDLEISKFCIDDCKITYAFEERPTAAKLSLGWQDPVFGRTYWAISRTDGVVMGGSAKELPSSLSGVVSYRFDGVCVKTTATKAPHAAF